MAAHMLESGMPIPAIHRPCEGVDYVLFPYESRGCIVYDDPAFGLVGEELCEGADEVVRHFMRNLRTRRIALLCSGTPAEEWVTFNHQGAENGWQVYGGLLGGRQQVMKLCPNFAHYYPQTPALLHFTAVKSKRAMERFGALAD